MGKIQNKSDAYKLYRLMSACFAVAYSVYCFVILPLYFSVDANIDFSDGVLPELIGYLGVAVENIAIFLFYGIMIFGIYRFGYSAFRGLFAVFGLAATYKYTVNVIVSWIRSGAIPTTWVWDIVSVVYYAALELFMLWIVTVAVRKIIGQGRGQDVMFNKLYDSSNCLMRSAMACSIVTIAVKVFGNVVNDIMLLVDYGFSGYISLLGGVILNYVSALLIGVICYAVAAFTAAQLMAKCEKTAA